jgi:hypothetical protein
MTHPEALLRATRRALHAASIGDLTELERALAERRAALDHASASERVTALQEGESIGTLIHAITRRIGDQQRRLDQIKTCLARTAPQASAVDLRA